MPYQNCLVKLAKRYTALGYRVGFSKGKKFINEYKEKKLTRHNIPSSRYDYTRSSRYDWILKVKEFISPSEEQETDGITLIPDGIICVDIDTDTNAIPSEWLKDLPSTWEEKTKRGRHYFYKSPSNVDVYNLGHPKIKWKGLPIDLLTLTIDNSKLDYDEISEWRQHIIISPTPGYSMIKPCPMVQNLPIAPDWLVSAILEPLPTIKQKNLLEIFLSKKVTFTK